jgi:hypothetical protein
MAKATAIAGQPFDAVPMDGHPEPEVRIATHARPKAWKAIPPKP